MSPSALLLIQHCPSKVRGEETKVTHHSKLALCPTNNGIQSSKYAIDRSIRHRLDDTRELIRQQRNIIVITRRSEVGRQCAQN